jgi:hypothetical protein
MDATHGSPTESEVRERMRRFAALRAALRTLSRAVHPSELRLASEQGQELLILLKTLAGQVAEGAGAEAPADVARADELLDQLSARIRELVGQLEIPQLRATLLVAQESSEVQGLIDVLLEGDLGDDKNLRTLEYLCTTLCSEERNGRRMIVAKVGELLPRLREFARSLGDMGEQALFAERLLSEARTQLARGEDVGAIRDRVRRYKDELGSRVLHPTILEAVIAYNVALSNEVSGIVEDMRSIDRFAEELFDRARAGGEAAATRVAPPESARRDGFDVLASRGFTRLLGSLRGRLIGEPATDELAGGVVGAYRLEGLSSIEIEAFESQEEDHATCLTRLAVAVGLTVHHRADVELALRRLGIDADLVEGAGVDQLMEEMTAVAKKLFADSRYEDAFRLSEVKTRNLVPISAQRSRPPVAEPAGSSAGPLPWHSRLARVLRLDGGRPGGQVWAVGALLATLALLTLWHPWGGDLRILKAEELSQLSPFLDSGYRHEVVGSVVFSGTLNAAWDYLGTPERVTVAREIGERFEARGVERVVLIDRLKRTQVRYADGALIEARPRPTVLPE